GSSRSSRRRRPSNRARTSTSSARSLLSFIKEFLHPSSPLTLVVVLGAGVAWTFALPSSRWPRRYLLAVLLFMWFISSYVGASLLVAGIGHGYGPLRTRQEARGAEAVVVLSGGASTFSAAGQVVGVVGMSSALRALEGARVAKLIGARLVVSSGGVPRPDLQLR